MQVKTLLEIAQEFEHLEPSKPGFERRVAQETGASYANNMLETLAENRSLEPSLRDAAVAAFATAFAVVLYECPVCDGTKKVFDETTGVEEPCLHCQRRQAVPR